MKLPGFGLPAVEPSLSFGFSVEPARVGAPPLLVVSFLTLHIRIPLGRKKDP